MKKLVRGTMKEELIRYLKGNALWDEYRERRDRFDTYEKCLAAVKKDGYALRFVDASMLGERYYDVCIAAVKQNGYALYHVDAAALAERYYDVCLAAVEQNGYAAFYIKTNLEEER